MHSSEDHYNKYFLATQGAERFPPDAEVTSSILDAIEKEEISAAGFERIMGNALGTASTGRWGPDGQPDDTMPRCDADASTGYPADWPAPSGQFRLLRPHARGGLGEVYLAYDQRLHRVVALKQTRGHDADGPHGRARLYREAAITGNLEHPGIVPVYQLGQHGDGRPYYCMRFVQGVSLRTEIERFHSETSARDPGSRTLDLRRLLVRFVAVCNTIAYAHSRSVLHRDIKPHNIVLGPYGETLIVDWGLAKTIGSREEESVPDDLALRPPSASASEVTLEGQIAGTPGYMSPEQARGLTDQIGPASDIYNLGATLYTLLTGRGPFERGGDIRTVLQKVIIGQFPAPRAVRPGIPRSLEAICLKAMARQPEDRYAAARELAEDLERWLADEPVLAYREPPSTRLARWCRRHRPMMTGAVIATMLTLAGSLVLHARSGKHDPASVLLKAANHDLKAANTDLLGKLARSRDDLGLLNRQLGRLTNASENYRQASSTWKLLARQHPGVREFQVRLAASEKHLKSLMGWRATGKSDEAKPGRQKE
jgi:serine/threonine-protein kinase